MKKYKMQLSKCYSRYAFSSKLTTADERETTSSCRSYWASRLCPLSWIINSRIIQDDGQSPTLRVIHHRQIPLGSLFSSSTLILTTVWRFYWLTVTKVRSSIIETTFQSLLGFGRCLFLNPIQSVGLLGWEISPSQDLYLHTNTEQTHTGGIHASSGIRTYDPRVWAGEDNSWLSPRWLWSPIYYKWLNENQGL
jgi:hypothetical protein